MLAELAEIAKFGDANFLAVFLVFVRIAAIVSLAPGFGEVFLPARMKLAVALAYSAIVWTLAAPQLDTKAVEPLAFALLAIGELVTGIILGLTLRYSIYSMQIAAAIIAQSASLSQIFGPGAAPDPLPAIGNLLLLTAIAAAFANGLHVKLALAMASSYDIVAIGKISAAHDAAEWLTAHASGAFNLAFSLAASFLAFFLLINIAYGAINRAMPTLMVSFVGAPVLTAVVLNALMYLSALMLEIWLAAFETLLKNPFG